MDKPCITTDQCKDCIYWKKVGGCGSVQTRCCYYLLDMGKRRKRDGGRCLSKVTVESGRRGPDDKSISRKAAAVERAAADEQEDPGGAVRAE